MAEGVLLLMKGKERVSDSTVGRKVSLASLCLSCIDQSVKPFDHDFHPGAEVGKKRSNTTG